MPAPTTDQRRAALERVRFTRDGRVLGHLQFPDDPEWCDVEPYYLREYRKKHLCTYMVQDSGGAVPTSFWIDELVDFLWVSSPILPEPLMIPRQLNDQPISLKQTAEALTSVTSVTLNAYYASDTQLAFLWLFFYGSAEDRKIIKAFAEKPCVFFVDVRNVRLKLARNDGAS